MSVKIEIKNCIPEGYTLTKESKDTSITLNDKGLEFEFDYVADGATEVEYDPHEGDSMLEGKNIQKKMVNGSIFNIETGFIHISDIYIISKSTTPYFKNEKAEKQNKKSYRYTVQTGDVFFSINTKEEQEEIYKTLIGWFNEYKNK
jgi:hypothetical protein